MQAVCDLDADGEFYRRPSFPGAFGATLIFENTKEG
jgi:hypothetical protein